MELTILSGMSGAGKATAGRALEEAGFSVVDNLPPTLLPALVQSSATAGKLCAVIDARSGSGLEELSNAVTEVEATGIKPSIVFLDATNAVLVQRYSETRRHHPFRTPSDGVLAAVEKERMILQPVRDAASTVIDTTDMSPNQLRRQICESLLKDSASTGLMISITSFGFKFGLPIDSDLVFDVRFLVNPHYVDELRPLDGRNKIIDEFVMKDPGSQEFVDHVSDLLKFALPRYVGEGKAYLTVSIGCTGGRHRSVVIAEHLASVLRENGYSVESYHRDVAK